MNRFLSTILCCLCFFPFIEIVNFGTDTQPYALLFSIIILIFYGKRLKIPKIWVYNFWILAFASFLFLFSISIYMDPFSALRSYLNYFSIFLISLAVYNVLKINDGINEKLIKTIIIVWLIIGLIQLIYPDFLLFLVAGGRTSIGRGVPGLTAEPSFYGYMCFFTLLMVLDFKRNKNIYIIILLLQILVLAQSTITLVYLLILILFIVLKQLTKVRPSNLFKIIVIIIGLVLGFNLLVTILPESRIVKLSTNIIENKGNLERVAMTDESVSQRLDAIINSVTGMLKNSGLPHGFNNRIMSGYGAVLIELGVVGIILIVSLFKVIVQGHAKYGMVYAITITIIMFSAIQLASPIFAFYIGYSLYKRDKYKSITEISIKNKLNYY